MTSMIVHTANAERLAYDVMAEILQPRQTSITLPGPSKTSSFQNAKPVSGKYNPENFPYFDEILRALSPSGPLPHRHADEIGAARRHGSRQHLYAGLHGNGSGDLLYVWPTVTKAEKLVEDEACAHAAHHLVTCQSLPMKSRMASTVCSTRSVLTGAARC